MIVKRTIVKDVSKCQECPYCSEDRDMGATFYFCGLIGVDAYEKMLPDINVRTDIISKVCPLREEKK